MGNRLTPRDQDFAKWYTEVCDLAKLFTYGDTKGTINYLPNSWKIWEEMQKILNNEFEVLGIENVLLPLFIKTSEFVKEQKHIEGFAPEAYIVTKVGQEVLEDPLIVRPTSEVLFSQLFSQTANTYKQLPLKYNQWCTVYRAEKTTKPFLRGCEIVWHEAHCLFTTQEEAEDFAVKVGKVYDKFLTEVCCLPMLSGRKTEGEKFAGAVWTNTREVWSYDKQMIQTGTSHFLGQNFSKMYNIKVQDKNNQFFPPYYTSHGTTQRMIGDIIVVHGDDKGIVMPFKLAAKQIIIGALNINENPKILELANSLKASLSNYRVKVDDTNNSFGFKIAESETLGTPFFVILGKRELENNTLTIVRRDTGEKISVAENEIVNKISELSVDYDKTLYTRAKKRMDDDIVYVDTIEEFEKQAFLNKIVLAPWGGEIEDEEKIKKFNNYRPRCVKDDTTKEELENKKCFLTGKKAFQLVYFARAY